jgi:hypothetical protein
MWKIVQVTATQCACFFSLFLLAFTLEAQESKKDSFFTGVDISLDVLKLSSLALPYELKLEGGAKVVLFNHLGLAYEHGYGKLEPERAIKNGTYTSEGTYFRAGADYIFALDPKNSLYLGIRYGQSQFDDRGTIEITGQIEDDLNASFERTGLSADWYEVLLGTESEVLRRFYVGAMLRLRILGSYDAFEPIDVYAIPGYGRTFDQTIPAGNIYVKYRLSF